MTEKYTPSRGDYITLQGKKDLPARRRVQWFRGDHPDWTITTSIVELDWQDGHAVIRADVLNQEGRLIASGMKSETRKGFADFVEKAETGAIARAVAIAGYGTEDALDLDEGGIADSPGGRSPSFPRSAPVGTDMRERLLEIAKAKGIDHAGLERFATQVGIAKGERATPEQLVALINVIQGIESPSGGHSAPAGGAVPEGAAPPTTPPADAPTSEAATGQGSEDEAVPLGTSSDPAPALTFDDVLRVSGGVEVPPAPGSEAYRALPTGVERAAAKAYHEKTGVPA
jgi:hypothetical protein